MPAFWPRKARLPRTQGAPVPVAQGRLRTRAGEGLQDGALAKPALAQTRWSACRPAAFPLDLYDHRQHHRAAAQALVDEGDHVFAQVLLEQRDLAHFVLRGVRERPLDRLADFLDDAVHRVE